VGPCPSGSCIFVGDIGDNKLERSSYGIYRVTEPSITSSVEGTVAFDYFPFAYDDGPHNAEALVVDPVTGRVYVVLKEMGSALFFECLSAHRALASRRPRFGRFTWVTCRSNRRSSSRPPTFPRAATRFSCARRPVCTSVDRRPPRPRRSTRCSWLLRTAFPSRTSPREKP